MTAPISLFFTIGTDHKARVYTGDSLAHGLSAPIFEPATVYGLKGNQVQVRLTDQSGEPLSGWWMNWELEGVGGEIIGSLDKYGSLTDADGYASNLYIGPDDGVYRPVQDQSPGGALMGLWNINTVSPCMSYIDYGSCVPSPGPTLWGPLGLTYNGQLITCPKHYKQSTNWVSNFFYEPGNDRIIAHIVLNTTYWPGWDVQRYEFNAEDGAWCNREEALAREAWIGIWGAAYTRAATMGSFNKIYACRNNETDIREISWQYCRASDRWLVSQSLHLESQVHIRLRRG